MQAKVVLIIVAAMLLRTAITFREPRPAFVRRSSARERRDGSRPRCAPQAEARIGVVAAIAWAALAALTLALFGHILFPGIDLFWLALAGATFACVAAALAMARLQAMRAGRGRH